MYNDTNSKTVSEAAPVTSDERFDAVVIGSGMGGLSAARMLAEFGEKRVLLLEQHYTLGGLTHEFTREGRYHFGTGVHYLTAGPSMALNFLADGRAQFQRLPYDYDVLHFPGFDFAVPASEAEFKSRLKSRFPEEAEAIDRFFAKVRWASLGLLARNVAVSLAPIIRAVTLPIIEFLFRDTFQPIRDVVSRHFRDPELKAVVSARWGLFGPPPAQSAFGTHAVIAIRAFMDGAAHPVGGPRALGRAIIDGLERRGVELRPRQRVVAIAVNNRCVTGVEVEDMSSGGRYCVAAPCIVSAVGVRNTAALLDAESAAPWHRELNKLPQGIATLLLFIGLARSPRELGVAGENHWFMPDHDDDLGAALPIGDGVLFVSFSSLNNPAARAHTMEVMHFVDPEVFRKWSGTTENDRPEDYQEFKATVTERLLDRLDAAWPGFRALVAFAELATPLTFKTYQNSFDGGFYGLPNVPERLRSRLARCRTDITGLYLSGQDAWNAGIEAALWGGIQAANAILAPRQIRRMWSALRSPIVPLKLPWQGYMRVTLIQRLTPTVKKIRMEPLGGGKIPFTFRAGQYLTLELPVENGTIERSYSIVSAPTELEFVDIAVRHFSGGLGSTFLHRELLPGEALRLSGPAGDFTIDPDRDLGDGHLLLIAGGIGITPMISVLGAAASTGYRRRVTLLASFRSDVENLFREEIEAFQAMLPGLVVRTIITRTGPASSTSSGRLDREALWPHVPGVGRVHLCGPDAFMSAMIAILSELQVRRDIIHTEAFVSSRLSQSLAEQAQTIRLEAVEAAVAGFAIEVRNGRAFPCVPGQTLLAAANGAGIPFAQSCHEGVCGKCRTSILSGPFAFAGSGTFSDAEIAAGWVLACQTLPRGDLEINLVPSATSSTADAASATHT
ncbi:FAD-binding oxidoreductase [Agrobacterium sp. SOY23]|uniref:2Fe-2S iron-sulfur cluster-binding protein n=1 Tax=Agrobacterium sp. SOY23 TaxID=3014555 RepID=UPI0022AF3B12|nr:2Fe-2S iron-sulfur cluster-binding protein [Agrobacterium sp. SOY23]MCZ4431287.1 FAD-binding oxidoreductase [Agrobacterium sp. SOY23]